MRWAFGKPVFSIVVLFLIFCVIVAPNASVESVTSGSSSGTDTKGPRMDHLQMKFYGSESAEFQGLLNNEIDFMDSPLTTDQYRSVLGNPDIQLIPYYDLMSYYMVFNNNATDPSHTQYRKAMNYTEFRQAMACLVDKNGLISGQALEGFATRIDTLIPRPAMDNWVDFNVSKYDSNGNLLNNYPWDYNITHALEILWNNNWYSHTFYPTFASLQAAFPLTAAGGTDDGVVYPPSHPRAGQPIDTLIGYTRIDLPDSPQRIAAGAAFSTEIVKLGINVTLNYANNNSRITQSHDFDFYTAGENEASYDRGLPNFYLLCTPGGYDFGMISDANLTQHATMQYYNATSAGQSINEALICQDIIVKQAMFAPLYSPIYYYAFRKGWLGVGTWRPISNPTNLFYADYSMLNAWNENTRVDTIRLGIVTTSDELNPIFAQSTAYEVLDRMFTCPVGISQDKQAYLGKNPAGGDMPWMVTDWKYELGPDGNAIVTLWFNHNIKWQDGVPFTIDDFNYTIYLNQAYGDSYGGGNIIKSFDLIDNWTCRLYFYYPSIRALYWVSCDVVPEHIYKYIAIPRAAASGASSTGLHGEWPGKDSLPSEILPGAPFTWNQLTGPDGGKYVWVGTGMWKYHPSSYVNGSGGGIMFDANRDFFLDTPPTGELDFNYYWNLGSPPQGGSYKVGLSDLVMLAKAYGSTGNPPSPNWNPACDIAAPSGIIGLSDLVTLATNYGREWGNYTAANG